MGDPLFVRLNEKLASTATRWEDLCTSEDTTSLAERLSDLLPHLPPVEADLLTLRQNGAGQHELARLFGVSQAAISYRLDRAIERLRWLAGRPPKPESFRDDIEAVAIKRRHAMRQLFPVEAERRAAYVTYFEVLDETTSQSEAFRRSGTHQGVCHSTISATKRILAHQGRSETLARLTYLHGHYNILWEGHSRGLGPAFLPGKLTRMGGSRGGPFP